MNARRLTLAGLYFAGVFTGLVIAVLVRPRAPAPGGMTDLGRFVVHQLDSQTDWNSTGRDGQGLGRFRKNIPGQPREPITVSPDEDAWTRVRVYMDGLNVSEQLSRADHAAILEALARRRASYAADRVAK